MRAAMALFDGGDERETALFWVGLVKNEGVDLATERIEVETARPVDKAREFIVGGVARDRAPDDSEVTRIVERGEARDGDKLGAGNDRAHGQTFRMRVIPPRRCSL